jgi:hypothetical protein
MCHLFGRSLVLMSSTVSASVLTPSDLRVRESKSTLRAIVQMVFDSNPFEPVTFSSAAKKKKPLASYVLHPIIFEI